MKKSLYVVLFIILLTIAFVGGFRFNQSANNGESASSGDRKILHYVDPMNPANTSKEPGIAPCGMPMEPVYADEVDGGAVALPPGVVKMNTVKQQLIGVQTDKVSATVESARLRVLGKIVPDENKIYAIVSGTDGWMGEIHDSTTGSIVQKDQLMGKIRMYDYDFYTWQQRYLTELGNAGRRRIYISPLSGMAKEFERAAKYREAAGAALPDVGASITLPSKKTDLPSGDMQHHDMSNMSSDNLSNDTQSNKIQNKPKSPTRPTSSGIPPGTLYYGDGSQPTGDPNEIEAEILRKKEMVPELPQGPVPELPNTAVAELPQSADGPGLGPDSHRPDSESAEEVEPLKNDMEHSHIQETDKTMSMQGNPTMTDKQNDALAPHDHTSMSAANVPVKQNAADGDMMMQDSRLSHQMSSANNKKNPAHQMSGRHYFTGEDDILYASKARQELLDLGVSQTQLDELADTGVYVTSVQLHSPVDGLILSRNVTPRQKINRGQECFRVADVSTVWVEADVFDIEERLIQKGTLAKVSLPRTGEHRMAEVTEVLPYFTQESRTLKVRLELENNDYQFRPDMFVDVEFVLQLESTVTVPSSAVIDSGKHAIVYVVSSEGIFEPRFVATGWRFNDRTQILEGLSPGEQIVVSGNFLIDSESRMKLAAAKLMDDANQATEAPTTRQAKNGRSLPNVMTNMTEGHKAIDPICGMTIDPAKAVEEDLTANINGQNYYFCSEECLEEFHRHGPKIENTIPQDSSNMPNMDMTVPHTDHNSINGSAMDMSMKSPSSKEQGKAQDPVCGMDVDISRALSEDLTSEYEGTTYYFCSPLCKENFERSPPDFVGGKMPGEMTGHEGHIHD